MKSGLVSISFRQNSVEEIIKAVKAAELTCIEWGSDVHAPYDNTEKIQEIVKLQKKYGIECSSYGTYFKLDVTPIEELEGYIKAAKLLGTDILRLWCGSKSSAEYTKEEKENLFSVCRKAAKIAEENNVKLCMECHIGTFTDEINAALELMNGVNSPNFKMYWQPNQTKTFEENCNYAAKIAPFVESIHIFNWEGMDRFPLAGAVDVWKKYLSYFKGDKALLLEFMPDDKIETLKTEAEALRKIKGDI
ncbi:MAG: sugar phosphate isomerase/epimerase [Clostridia bacterium]|nr:sugar phosphate isomerase/epimerase [Clostridia bacterium]